MLSAVRVVVARALAILYVPDFDRARPGRGLGARYGHRTAPSGRRNTRLIGRCRDVSALHSYRGGAGWGC